jgi:UDP-N-acetylglucosamine 2-epimerase
MVVVQGDTMSALVGAQAAAEIGIPVVHIEAGIRSGDLSDPWPEERFRREITQLATYHFAPTLCAYDNLVADGVYADNIFLTGNPIVSAIQRYTCEVPVKVPDMVILFTMHRREWILGGIKGVLEGFMESALRYPEIEIVWPVHPGVSKQIPDAWVRSLPANVRLISPMAYRPAIRLLARSLGVATDSGGLQEESAILGVPCAVVRHVTDRPESIEAGVARLFSPDSEGIQAALVALRERTILRQPTDLYGTVGSANKIAVLLGNLSHGAKTQITSSIAQK